MNERTWAVVGAGPAGIVAVGMLLDHGIPGERIAWLDPDFAVGDFGAKWHAVSSNTPAELFREYLHSAESFRYDEAPPRALRDLDPTQTCPLGLVGEVLAWITSHLIQRVEAHRTTARSLARRDGRWLLTADTGEVTADAVVLATGATPKTLDHPGLTPIALDVVLDPAKLADVPLAGAGVAVFGSSHSAMIALPNLLDTPAARIVNFYRSPLKYAVELDDWTLFDDTGLKGGAAHWARENLDSAHTPGRLTRVALDDPDYESLVASCDHVVDAIGLAPRRLPADPHCGVLDYDPTNGIIAPGLFGLGVGYPQKFTDPLGGVEYRVGLVKFSRYLTTVLPVWLRYAGG